MGTKGERAELITELRELREEVRRLREAQASHVCYHFAPQPWYPAGAATPYWPLTITYDTTTTLPAVTTTTTLPAVITTS